MADLGHAGHESSTCSNSSSNTQNNQTNSKTKKTIKSKKKLTNPKTKKTIKSIKKLTKQQKAEAEKLFIQYMVAGHQPREAMDLAGLNYKSGTKEYKRIHGRGTRAKKKFAVSSAVSTTTSTLAPEDAVVKYMMEGHKPKQAFTMAGLQPTSSMYNRACVRASRLHREADFLQRKKAQEIERKRQVKILQVKFQSVQQHRHEANRAMMVAETAYAEARQLEKQNKQLTKVLSKLSQK